MEKPAPPPPAPMLRTESRESRRGGKERERSEGSSAGGGGGSGKEKENLRRAAHQKRRSSSSYTPPPPPPFVGPTMEAQIVAITHSGGWFRISLGARGEGEAETTPAVPSVGGLGKDSTSDCRLEEYRRFGNKDGW